MNLFDLDPGSGHFCRPLSTPPTGVPRSVKEVVENFKGVTHLREGEPRFDTYRLALLSSVERWLLYSASNYRRALDMLVPVAAPWAHVTLYYSSFFAANAILGMFGGYVKTEGKRTVIDVLTQMPDSQEFLITRDPPLPAPSMQQGVTALSGRSFTIRRRRSGLGLHWVSLERLRHRPAWCGKRPQGTQSTMTCFTRSRHHRPFLLLWIQRNSRPRFLATCVSSWRLRSKWSIWR